MEQQFDKKIPVYTDIEENVAYLRKELGVGKSFDVIHLDVEYAEHKMAMFLVDGLVKDDLLHLLMKFSKSKKRRTRKGCIKKTLKNLSSLY
jgi:stage V sporulation protein AF